LLHVQTTESRHAPAFRLFGEFSDTRRSSGCESFAVTNSLVARRDDHMSRAVLHRDLAAYAVAVNEGEAKGAPAPERLIPAMIERFIATDRRFAKSRKVVHSP
jgi:hypothetical protein